MNIRPQFKELRAEAKQKPLALLGQVEIKSFVDLPGGIRVMLSINK